MAKSSSSDAENLPVPGEQSSSDITAQRLDNSSGPSHPRNYLHELEPAILTSLDTAQTQAIQTLINQVISDQSRSRPIEPQSTQNQRTNNQIFSEQKSRSKLIDIRFIIDLIVSRFYVVILVGKDVRKDRRSYPVHGITKVGNIIAASILIIAINLFISAFLLLGLYLLKSALGIDLLPGHFSDQIEKISSTKDPQ
ncbi:hypothetical protein [Acaryochloris sp. IP29b_bin.148]|uniref:hypothetical protein n=1 Tax=Acaryochloris sp. IP29b_bin.148 TaxID=2969218 RepID=UPI0026171019|nr:hypothetical protein [Acaryochloris sp. IP29b_bin.148]